jgi:hypothetical protein
MTWRLLALAVCVASVASGQGLFRDSVPVELTLVTNLRDLVRNRDSTRLERYGTAMTYRVGNGAARTVPATLRARGHFRRQARNCRFPPLKLELRRADARGTLFQGNTNLKITTSCRPGDAEYEQYILAEYAVYKAYEIVSPRFFRTRLARVTYRDSANATPDVQSWAFLVEDDSEVADRFNAQVDTSPGAAFDDLAQEQLDISALFAYFVGNTDWSIAGRHNVALLRDRQGGFHAVSYDFDWSGAVNARYAFPDGRLGIARTTQRLYRGPCRTLEAWQPLVRRFVDARPRIEAMYTGLPVMSAERKAWTLRFLAEFYRDMADPGRVRRALIDPCQKVGN